MAVGGDHRMPWLATVPGTRVIQAGMDRSSIELDPGVEPDAVLAAAVPPMPAMLHFEVADPTLEQVFIDWSDTRRRGGPSGAGRAGGAAA